jgi:CHAT domain-containing protein
MRKQYFIFLCLLLAAIRPAGLLLSPSSAAAADRPGTRDLVYEEDEPQTAQKNAPDKEEAPDRDLGPGPYYTLNKEQAKIVKGALDQFNALRKKGQNAQALSGMQELLEALAGLPQPVKPAFLNDLYVDLLMVLNDLGRFREAEKVGKKLLKLSEMAYGADSDQYLAASFLQAEALTKLDRYAEALERYDENFRRRVKKYGPAHERTLSAGESLLHCLRSLSRYEDGLALSEALLQAARKKHAAASGPVIGLRYARIGLLYSIGDYEAVEKESLELIADMKKARKTGEEIYSLTLLTLGAALGGGPKQDKTGALRFVEEAWQGTAKKYGADHPSALFQEANYANALLEAEKPAEAKKRLEALLPKLAATYGEEHPVYVNASLLLGHVFLDMGDADASLAVLQDLLPKAQACSDRTFSIRTAYRLTMAYKAKGDLETAAFFGKQAVNAGQELLRSMKKPELRKTLAGTLTEVYQALADVLMDQGKTAEAQRTLGLLKETELAAVSAGAEEPAAPAPREGTKVPAQAAPADMLTGMDEKISGRYNEINNQIVALAGEQRALLDKRAQGETLTPREEERLKILRQDMTTARKAFTAFMKNLSGELAASDKRAADLGNLETYQRLLATLGDGVVLLQTIVTDNRIWLILTTQHSQVAKASPFDVKQLPEKITAFRDVLQDPEQDSRPLAGEFYDALIRPLAPALEQAKAKMVMFSLDGQLRYIPMAALYDGKEWLIQKYTVSLFNDATKAGLAVPPVGNWKVAGLGVTKEHKYGRGKFTALPAVKDELASIVRTGAGAGGVLNGSMTLDEGFTADALQDVLETGYPVIHLASHFHFDKKNPEQSFLLLGDGTGLPLTRIESEDFKFKNVDLIALFACQTARGGVDASGKEIEGFGALAQKRGAKAVLATLWPVFDESTGLLMAGFYRLHEDRRKPSIAAALRDAQLLMIDNRVAGKDFRQPFYWAPFVLMGDWR